MYDELLSKVIADWRETGVLTEVLAEVIDVWTANTQRHDPDAGDDALTLGLVSSRNIANRTERLFMGRPGVIADQHNNSLRVVHRGRTLRVYKLGGTTTTVDPDSADWSSSETKLSGPMDNALTQQLALTDFPAGAAAFAGAIPEGPEHLHLAWAGEPDTGKVAIYVGFPRDNRDGGSPWYAVDLVYRDEPQESLPALSADPNGVARFDELAPPELQIHARRDDSALEAE